MMKHRLALCPTARQVCVIPMLLALMGCQETLVFFEQTAFKLGISVNEEPPVPVEVTLGLKRRVVAVAPPKKPLEGAFGESRPEGEAVSLISRFDVIYHPDAPAGVAGVPGNPLAGKLQIISAFASGEAALEIAKDPLAMALVVGDYSFRLDPTATRLRDFLCAGDPDCAASEAKFAVIRACWPAAGVPDDTLMLDFVLQDAYAEQRRAVATCIGL